MRIKRLTIHRMPGFRDGGPSYDDLADGLNVIVGANGSGKTTTCRAIRGLLWGDELVGLKPVSLQSAWADGDDTLLIDREADSHVWQMNGTPCEAPDLPPADLARCYTVTIDDLFEIDDTARAGKIVNALAGGYDLAAVRAKVTPFKKRQASDARKALVAAERLVREVQDAHEALSGEADSLSSLNDEAGAAAEARAKLDKIKIVRGLDGLLGEIARARASLESFPPDMDRLGGKEGETLADLRNEIDAAETKLREASQTIEHQQARRAAADLPDGGVAPERLAEQQRHLTALKEAERDLARSLDVVTRAAASRDEALRCLNVQGDAEAVDAIDVQALDQIESLHGEVEAARANLAAARARLDMLGPDEPACDTVQLERGLASLYDWLAARTPDQTPWPPSTKPFWILAALLLGTTVVLAVINPAWAALLVVEGALALWAFKGALPRVQKVDRRNECQARFAQTGLDAPDAWTAEDVGQKIRQLVNANAQAHRALQLQAERLSARQQAEQFTDSVGKLDTKRAELAERVGVAPRTGMLALTDMATNLRELREASTELAAARAAADATDASRHEQLEKINAFLSSFGLDACDAYAAAQASFDGLKARADDYADAAARLAAAMKDADDARQTIARFETRRGTLFTDAGLGDGDDQALTERLAQLDDYRKAKAELRDLEAKKSVFESQLAGADDLLGLSVEALDQAEVDLDTCASRRDDILGRIQSIRDRIDRAKAGHDLGDANAVGEQRDVALGTMAGAFLLDGVETEYRADSEPGVLRRARDWFAMFTHHRYTLQAGPGGDNGGAAFRAVDATTNRGLGLDELSRGTRMQLLLAVRLAFAAEAEKHRSPLPFILDEVLSSSDPERFKAIIDCLLVLVKEGRQVFYFTCQPGDAKAWDEAATKAGITDRKFINLDEARRNGVATGGPLSESATSIREIPSPDGASPEEYGRRLGVTELDPSAPAAGADVAHFVDDADQLYGLRRAGIRQLGPLRGLKSLGPSDAFIAPDALARTLARAELLDAFAGAWSVGRGRPLTREDLTEAGVSGKFIDGVAEIARELDWDAERLMAAVEARDDERLKGFRTKTVETMRDWMQGAGHLSSEQTLGEDEARTRVLAAANEHVKAGVLTGDEVRELFASWWGICTDATRNDV